MSVCRIVSNFVTICGPGPSPARWGGPGSSSFGGWAAGEGFESGGGVEGLEEGLVSEDAASDAAE